MCNIKLRMCLSVAEQDNYIVLLWRLIWTGHQVYQPQAGVLSVKPPTPQAGLCPGKRGGWRDERKEEFQFLLPIKTQQWSRSSALKKKKKKRSTPAGMLTQNLYHQYLIARLLPLINGLMSEFSPLTKRRAERRCVCVCVCVCLTDREDMWGPVHLFHLWLTWLMLKQV